MSFNHQSIAAQVAGIHMRAPLPALRTMDSHLLVVSGVSTQTPRKTHSTLSPTPEAASEVREPQARWLGDLIPTGSV